tara:strand:+ start:1843 stop:2415 length:573 start_codon:yes stop_codon:yes gene_type:complete
MEIKNCIKIIDDIMPASCVSTLIRYLNTQKFEEARISGNEEESTVDFNTRKTHVYGLSPLSDSLTHQHWANYLASKFLYGIKLYQRELNCVKLPVEGLTNIDALKYQDNGFYTWHVDDGPKTPRTLSCVLFLNNEYEGGQLAFSNIDGTELMEVAPQPARMVIWPSSFLFPHAVKPVTQGTRFSIVSWAR